MMRRMRTSSRGLKLLMSFEGFRSRAIALGDGRFVVGFGHTKGARDGAVVSKSEAISILQRYDLPPIEQFVQDSVTAPLNQNEFDALVSLVFNIGEEAFRTSDVLAFLNSGEKLAAGEAFTAWRKAQLNGRLIIVDALIRRRAAEKALFMLHPGGTPIAPSAHIRPVLDERAARFVPSEPPIVATRERKPAPEEAVTVPVDTQTPGPELEAEPGYVPEDDGQAELEFGEGGERFIVPDGDEDTGDTIVPVAANEDVPPLDHGVEDPAAVDAEMPSDEASEDKTAPELAAGALVARLTRILGDESEGHQQDRTSSLDVDTPEDGPTPDEITRAISELAEGTAPIVDDLPPLPENVMAGDDAEITEDDIEAVEIFQPKTTLIDDLEPIPDEVLHRTQAVAGANIDESRSARPRMGLSLLIYALLGLIGAALAVFGIVRPNTDLIDHNGSLGQFGYFGITILGGLLVLLALYFLVKTFRSRRP